MVARRMAEEMGIDGSRICPSCGQAIKNANWYAHLEGHRVQAIRRRGEEEW